MEMEDLHNDTIEGLLNTDVFWRFRKTAYVQSYVHVQEALERVPKAYVCCLVVRLCTNSE